MSDQASFLPSTLIEQYQERLIADLKTYEFQKRPTVLKNKGNKWRVSSGMQKAIRRGNVDMAIRCASAIHSLEPDYVWRRLCTVVLEEVGVCDLDLCARFLWVATNKTWRNKNGGSLEYLYMLVEKMCRSVKDRNACDLPLITFCDPGLEDHRKAAKLVTGEQLAEVIADNNAPLRNRALCAQHLAHVEHPLVTKSEGKQLYIEALKAAGFDPLMIDIVRMGMSKQYEMMPYGLPFVNEMVKRSSELLAEPDELTDLPLVGGLPSEAFDIHNQEGKRAIAYFYAACKPVREAFNDLLSTDKQVCHHAIGVILFRIEGQLVDSRLVYDGSTQLRKDAEAAGYSHNGIPPEVHQPLFDVLAEHLEELHAARMRVISPTP